MELANKVAPYVAIGAVVLFLGMLVFGLTLAAGFASLGGGGSQSNQAATTTGAANCSGQKFTGKQYKGGSYKEFVAIYQAAAKKYNLGPDGPNYLAAIHEQETTFRGSAHGANSSAGAQGPMQFMPATWATYGVDANGDGKKDPLDPEDAIFGAARYLKASGAPNWSKAILAYNPAGWYVSQVMAKAKKYHIQACP